jgi:hypothetical protein
MEEKTAPVTDSGAQPHGCFVCSTAMPLLEKCFSGATRDHFRASKIEFLKGLRSLLDDKISHMSTHESKGTHVTVE